MLGAEAHRDQLRGMVRPLRFIFWGGLICLIDVNVQRFDVLPDLLGLTLIAVGAFLLGRIELTRSYSRAMTFVKAVCVLALAREIAWHFVDDSGVAWVIASSVANLIGLAAVLVFCLTMRLLCLRLGLVIPAASWRTTTLLCVALMALPVALLNGWILTAVLFHAPMPIDMGQAAALFLVVVIPCIHFFVSTSRTARAAECEPFVREIARHAAAANDPPPRTP